MNFSDLRKRIEALMQFDFNIAEEEVVNNYLTFKDMDLLESMLNDVHLGLIIRAEFLIKGYLEKNSNDIEALFLLGMVCIITPMEDDLQAIAIMQKILAIDPRNYNALLILAFEEHLLRGVLDNETFNRLQNFQGIDSEVQSLIELAKSWYYAGNSDDLKYEEALRNSIELCSKFAWNYIDLGNLYIKQGKIKLGRELIEQGNMNKVLQKKFDAESLINYNDFIDDRIKGIVNYIHDNNSKC